LNIREHPQFKTIFFSTTASEIDRKASLPERNFFPTLCLFYGSAHQEKGCKKQFCCLCRKVSLKLQIEIKEKEAI
jgi:hypothetical protein